ncbi:MAG: cation-translocating P-type ATPase [Oscillospiraceae bacterium]|nr:cation-translocating P-type ATPase [Oscillospiraceae bacterium]
MENNLKSAQQICAELNVAPHDGLTAATASRRLTEVGENKLVQGRRQSILARFFSQFKDVMILILLIAAAVSFYVALQGHDPMELFEPALILLIVILNAVMGTLQESKAEKALEALQRLAAPQARVRRDGQEHMLDAAKLVPGDIVLMEAGDYVPADGRLLVSANLKIEESALTGESLPAEKDAKAQVSEAAALGDRTNMAYAGCSVTYGRGEMVVTETGMATQMGQIAGMLNTQKQPQTPLQKKLAKLGRILGVAAVAICAVIFVIGFSSGMPALEIFMVSVSLAVSAIPEGLPAIVTIVLSMGVTRLAKRNAVVRKLPAVETLGSASVICSDKTGTLTQNRMTLVQAYSVLQDTLEPISTDNSAPIAQLLRLAALCCDATVTVENGKEVHLGDPTETCIVAAARKNGSQKQALTAAYPRVAEVPFDSERKLMSVVCQIGGKYIVIAKGGFDTLAARCDSGNLEKASGLVDEMGAQALRVLAVACKTLSVLPETADSASLETGLTLIGLVGMIDPPREEAKQAVSVCRQAGIRPVMITGDHVITASAIAKQLGILQKGDRAITGAELAALSEPQLREQVSQISVYARVSPQDKIRIVKAWQNRGAVVSMTGDGVNDAPALKASDIGCAMGITGTAVAKGASDLVLMDDNFATIVEAVREGRGIYENIRRTVVFLLGTNIGEVLVTLIAMIFWRKAPLLSMQLLWINLVTDSLPAIALGVEKIDSDIMNRKPKPREESLFAHGLGAQVIAQGAMFAGLTLFAFWLGGNHMGTLAAGRTMAFLVLGFSQIFHTFNMRAARSIFHIGVFTNRFLNGAAGLSLLLMCLVLFVPPVAAVFELVMLPGWLYLCGIGLALVPVAVLEAAKALGVIRSEHGAAK